MMESRFRGAQARKDVGALREQHAAEAAALKARHEEQEKAAPVHGMGK